MKYLTFDDAALLKLKIVSIRNIKDNNDLEEKLIGKQFSIMNDDLNNDEVRIGRSRKCNDIVIKDLSISTNHAKITFSKGRFYLIDLQSKHGTFVNGKKLLIEEYNINVGSEIRFGRIVCHVIGIKDINNIVSTNSAKEESLSIQHMNYYENLLKEEHTFNLYNDQILSARKRRKNNDDTNNTTNIMANVCNDSRVFNNTSTRIQEFSERTRITPLIEPVTHDSIYSIGASIFRSLGGNPLKKLGRNYKEEDANEPIKVTRRIKNLGLGASNNTKKTKISEITRNRIKSQNNVNSNA